MFPLVPRGLSKGTRPKIPSRVTVPGSATGDSIKGGPRGYRGSAPRPGCCTSMQWQGTEVVRSGRFVFQADRVGGAWSVPHPSLDSLRTLVRMSDHALPLQPSDDT